MVLLPIVELHSVALRLKREETDNTIYEMCGEVIVENAVFSEYMFKEDEESDNSETVLPDGTLNLMGPSRCIAGNGYVFCVRLRDKKSGLEVCNGFYDGLSLPEDYWFDNPLRAVIPGKHGSVVLHYSVFKVGVQASVKVKLLPHGDDQCSRKHLVYGTMYVRYVNYESKYPGEFSKKHYRSTLIYASPSNPKKVEESGRLIQLSRNVVGVPDFSELIIEAELWDTYYGVSETRAPDVKGFVSFIPEPKSSGPMTIHGTNCSIEVEVGWIRNSYKEYYDKATLARMSTKKLLSEIAALRKKGAST